MQQLGTYQSEIKQMKEVLEQLLQIHQIDYLIVDCHFQIILMSAGMKKFASSSDSMELGCDARLLLPELVGLEDDCLAVFEGRKTSYQLNCIAKEIKNMGTRYFNLNIDSLQPQINFSNCLLLSLEDITKTTVMYQDIVQKSNEYCLLVSQKLINS